jgi:hypothetical protein
MILCAWGPFPAEWSFGSFTKKHNRLWISINENPRSCGFRIPKKVEKFFADFLMPARSNGPMFYIRLGFTGQKQGSFAPQDPPVGERGERQDFSCKYLK